jgi:mannose-6-phosphate isomerase class I
VGATGPIQGVPAIWQLQGTIGKHFKDDRLQVKPHFLRNPKLKPTDAYFTPS